MYAIVHTTSVTRSALCLHVFGVAFKYSQNFPTFCHACGWLGLTHPFHLLPNRAGVKYERWPGPSGSLSGGPLSLISAICTCQQEFTPRGSQPKGHEGPVVSWLTSQQQPAARQHRGLTDESERERERERERGRRAEEDKE